MSGTRGPAVQESSTRTPAAGTGRLAPFAIVVTGPSSPIAQTGGVDLAAELARRVVVLDGGLATELERRGADLSSALWSARLLRDDPGEIVEVHRAFVEAGAEVVTSASYQASFEGLGDEAELLMR